jgi:hypothetical protein
MLRKPDGGPRRNAGFWGVSCLFALILVWRARGAGSAAREGKGRVGSGRVHRKYSLASVTIEDGFGFEAVVPVKSPI